MRFIKFLLALLVTVGFTYLLAFPQKIGKRSIPAVGELMNPFTGFWRNAEAMVAPVDETLNFAELQAPVKVVYDDRLVPHIFAENMTDAVFVQGYVQAKHRLWQMDFTARSGGGRLAEVVGEAVLARDIMQRKRGMKMAAQNAIASWTSDNETLEIVSAYRDGVNTYINSLSKDEYPIEFKLLGYEPETYTFEHMAYVQKEMAKTLSSREEDLESTNTLKALGKSEFDWLFPEQNPRQSPVIPKGTSWTGAASNNASVDTTQFSEEIGQIDYRPYEVPAPFIGSNNWAVGGEKTLSGNPILCNDPHLGLTLPSVWYEMQIHTPDFNVYGVSLCGIPGIIIGFNEYVAWGVTNAGHDVSDWFTIDWVDDAKTKYRVDGKEKTVTIVEETFKVKGRADEVTIPIKITEWGPVVYEAKDMEHYTDTHIGKKDFSEKYDMALKWMAHLPGNPKEPLVFLNLNAARNYDDYAAALLNYDNPAQNFVFASKSGDIALKVNGKLPLKNRGQGRFVQDGSKSSSDWDGFIPKSDIPQVKNPPRGFVSSANQHSTDESYPYYYNGSFGDYRGRVLNRKLARSENITAEDMMKLQLDNFSIKAEEALPLLIAHTNPDKFNTSQKELLSIAKVWDFNFDGDQFGPVIFERWWKNFYQLLWDEFAQNAGTPTRSPEAFRTIELMANEPDSKYFDIVKTVKKETFNDLATESFILAARSLKDILLENSNYQWNQDHQASIMHLTRRPFFSVTGVEAQGHTDALNSQRGGFGPSWRMIVELGDDVRAYGVYPGGQSGNPGSPYYKDGIKYWAKGEYFELFYMQDVDDDTGKRLYVQEFKN